MPVRTSSCVEQDGPSSVQIGTALSKGIGTALSKGTGSVCELGSELNGIGQGPSIDKLDMLGFSLDNLRNFLTLVR